MTGSSATEKDMGEATEGRVSMVRLARVVKTESSQVGAVEIGLVVKVEQAVVRVVPDNTLPFFECPRNTCSSKCSPWSPVTATTAPAACSSGTIFPNTNLELVHPHDRDLCRVAVAPSPFGQRDDRSRVRDVAVVYCPNCGGNESTLCMC